MIESTTAQIPMPVLIPPVTALPFAGVVAEAKIAIPRIPKVASIARNTKVPPKIADQESPRSRSTTTG
jgi:hypothetical protein